MYKIRYLKKARKTLLKIPGKWQQKIVTAIEGLQNDPFRGKKLQGDLEGSYSIRVWPYRVIYQVKKKKLIIWIINIGHRRDIYR